MRFSTVRDLYEILGASVCGVFRGHNNVDDGSLPLVVRAEPAARRRNHSALTPCSQKPKLRPSIGTISCTQPLNLDGGTGATTLSGNGVK